MITIMTNNTVSALLSLFVVVCFGACGQRPDPAQEQQYLRWLNDPENGYVVREVHNDLLLTAKHIPNEWQAHRDASNLPNYEAAKDSLEKLYARDITFLLTIAPKDASKNIMYRDITSVPEFQQRVNELNFNFGQYLKLRTDSLEIAPVLVSFENVYETAGNRNLLIRFLDETENRAFASAPWLTLVWVDEVFWTGVHRFKVKG